MKYLVLLFALFATAAKAETILMTCGEYTYRYSDGFLGLGTPKYEIRDESKSEWSPFCTPFHGANRLDPNYVDTVICSPGDKGINRDRQSNHKEPETVELPLKDSYWSSVTLDFLVLTRWDLKSGKQQCSRLN
jgi:hypothetical protein